MTTSEQDKLSVAVPSHDSRQEADRFRELLARARRQDAKAFMGLCDAELQRRWLLDVTVSFPAHLRSKLDPLDVVQETLQRAWSRISTFNGESRQEWHRWVVGILHKQVTDRVRYFNRHRREVGRERQWPSAGDLNAPRSWTTPSRLVALRDQHLLVARLLDELSETQRQAIVYRILEGLTTAEVAEMMGRTEDNVRVLLHRALRKLRQVLAEHNMRSTDLRPW